MVKTFLTSLLIFLGFVARAQESEVRFDKILYTHQKDTASELRFDSLKNTCGRFEFNGIYIKRFVEGKSASIFLITDRAIKLFPGRNIVYYKCVEVTEGNNSNDYFVVYRDSNTQTVNIGRMGKGYYQISIHQITTDR